MALLMILCFTGSALADDVSGMLGVGLQAGFTKWTGGAWDYSNVDEGFEAHIRYGLKPHWSLEGALSYGWNRPGALAYEDADFDFGAPIPYYTILVQPRLGVLFHALPDKQLSPYLGAGLNYSYWRIRDHTGYGEAGHFLPPEGSDLGGYDENADFVELTGKELGASFSAGLEYFTRWPLAFRLGGGLHWLFSQDKDNIGLSAFYNDATHVDANDMHWEVYLGFTWFFGSRDSDGDGIENDQDACPDQPEDFDGFQDSDGCPDLDNDGDGLPDAQDQCPDQAEDLDGFEDGDGCPDPDNDQDGVLDRNDQCPNEAEDADGFEDADGCPDPDNDQDGVLDAQDQCPGTPAGVEVDENGCPVVEEIKEDLILKGVHFESNKSDLTPDSREILDAVGESLRAWPDVEIEIQGHTDSQGSDAHNLELSEARANAVRDYFIAYGIDPARMTAVGYGEAHPIASNDNAAGRAENRRVELHRTN